MALESPVTEQDYEQLKAQLERLKDLDAALNTAQAAGVDVADRKRQVAELRSNLNKFKAAYFPGRV